jgi:hypothetical protein
VNQAPIADAGGPYSIGEGQALTLDASASHDSDAGDTLTYSWDVNGDGTFGDATGVAPTLSWAQLVALGLGDGPHVNNIRVRVSDGIDTTESGGSLLTLNNAAPSAGISGPSYSPLPGDTVAFALTANDPSPADQAAGFTFHIDWDGDGVVDESVSGPSGMVVNHVYSGPGSFIARVTAEEKDHGVGDPAATPVHILVPSAIQGLVYVDFNNDGALSGFDDLGQPVSRAVQTDAAGVYAFVNLRPSNAAGYTISEAQPPGFLEGTDGLGMANGTLTGSAAVQDVFSGIVLPAGGSIGENYNFGEQPATTGAVGTGQTAAIGFWQNNKGQALILALNGGATATQVGHWLAVTFPNMYASMDGETNAQVAAFYKTLFARAARSAPGGPPKTDAQVMATALAVYVTNQSLAGTTAATYGFQVTTYGVGEKTFNVGSDGAAFGVANNTNVSVLDLLLAVNSRSRNGLFYDMNGDGQINSTEASNRTMANDTFSAINEAGGM